MPSFRREGIPDKFCLRVSIFITNLKFDNVRGKIKDLLDAIMSVVTTWILQWIRHVKTSRCKQIVGDGMLTYKSQEGRARNCRLYAREQR